MISQDEITRLFSIRIRHMLQNAKLDYGCLYEIRMRIQQPMLLIYQNEEWYLTESGEKTKEKKQAFCVSQRELKETLEYMSNFSLYAFDDEVRQGFLTVQGGHRIGITGKVFLEKGQVKSMKYISSLNVRLSHQIQGCADQVLPFLVEKQQFLHTLIISPPRCGKTTLLRDCIRQLSDGTDYFHGTCVGVVDERSEIGGSYLGQPQNDLGMRTDLLDCCPKSEGIFMLVRSMSPEIIAVDEIGARKDVEAIETALYCGCKLLATVHGCSIEDVRRKPLLDHFIKEKMFERYVILRNGTVAGQYKTVYDQNGGKIGEVSSC